MMRLRAPSRSTRSRRGFTVTEMLIVFALISLLAGLIIGNLDGIFVNQQKKAAGVFVNDAISTPMIAYRTDIGNYPTTQEGLQALVTAPAGKEARWQGPYIQKLDDLTDPWGNPYQYRFPGQKNPGSYDLWSTGPDTASADDDIGNW